MTVAKSLVRAVIMGPPGSGKGTIAKRIVKDFGLTHLASGDILRKQVSDATPVGLQAQKYIASGLLVPDDVMMKLVLGELNSKCFQIKRFIIMCNILFVWNLSIFEILMILFMIMTRRKDNYCIVTIYCFSFHTQNHLLSSLK